MKHRFYLYWTGCSLSIGQHTNRLRLKLRTSVSLTVVLLLLTLRLPAQIITTIAGNGTAGFSGDGGVATNASLFLVSDVVVDGSGNIFIADYQNARIRKVSAAGIITTVAGNGTEGFSGDGGLATSAELWQPVGVAVDGSGNLFIADSFNHRIRKVSTNGIITTVAGSGIRASGYADIGDGGPATNAKLNFPAAIVVDGTGNLFIADTEDHLIRKVAPDGIIATVAGTVPYGGAPGGFSGDGGQATNAKLNFPVSIALDNSNSLFISDRSNGRIRKVATTGIITTVAGNGTLNFNGDNISATAAGLWPRGIKVNNDGTILIADDNNLRIRKVTANGVITTVAGNGMAGFSGDGGPATNAKLNFPTGVGIDGNGAILIADRSNYRIRRVGASAPMPVTWSSFTVWAEKSSVVLDWETVMETKNHHFEVERSRDARSWETIGQVATQPSDGQPRRTYQFVDAAPGKGIQYYRLKQVDVDGTTDYSRVQAVTMSANPALVIGPIPTASRLTIRGIAEPCQVQILDMTGHVLLTRLLTQDADINLGSLTAGIYLIRLTDAGGTMTQRFVKE